MPYCTQADVERHAGGPERLEQLADYDRDCETDATIVTAEIARADAWINTFARQRFMVPFADPAPDAIREYSAEHVVFQLKKNKGMLSEDDIVCYEARVEWLKMLAKGQVSPGEDPAPESSSHVKGRASARPDTKRVSREKLKGFA